MNRKGLIFTATLFTITGLTLLLGGSTLLTAGGSGYYFFAGLLLCICSIGLIKNYSGAVVVYAILLLATLLWSLWEVGLNGWALAPRLLALAVLMLLFTLPSIRTLNPNTGRWVSLGALSLIFANTLAFLLNASYTPEKVTVLKDHSKLVEVTETTEWKHWGNTLNGQRYVSSKNINRENVVSLELAWRYDSGLNPPLYLNFEATPLYADDKLFICLQAGVVAALEPDSGEELWRYTYPAHGEINFAKVFGGKCRGVSYYEVPAATLKDSPHTSNAPDNNCQRRILFSTPDGYLRAVDANTGEDCKHFGDNGHVDLQLGIGPLPDSARREVLVMPSSPPAIVNGVAVVGQTVSDLESLEAPAGVIRGYDAQTGELKWAWDAGRPGQTQLKPGEFYTPNTPNAWGVISGDEKLGLAYIPTGNSLPDYYGGSREPQLEKYSSSVVALDVETGLVRWHFQTVHHDTWDYDVAAQPVAIDLPKQQNDENPNADNEKLPALLVPTKLGQIFVLDRRNGNAIDEVMEKAVPGDGAVTGERLTSTQPYTSGFPSLAGPDLTEKDMWGLTPIDQLWCRIQFKKAHYQGAFTPIGTEQTLMYPGTAGGINWGSVSIDPVNELLFVNTLRFANFGRLVDRANAPADGYGGKEGDAIFEQAGTPYAFVQSPFMTALKVPCQRPPYGTVNVLALKTRQLVWSKPFGTAAKSGPWGIPLHIPLTMGVPNMGGSVVTAGGLAFIGAAQDRQLRAYDLTNGEVLWSAELPAVGVASPMSYVSAKTGKQYVVIAAGGHYGIPGPAASAVMAFALPD